MSNECATIAAAFPSACFDPVNCCSVNSNWVDCNPDGTIGQLTMWCTDGDRPWSGQTLPQSAWGLPNLSVLWLDDCKLVGPIPDYWNDFPSLNQVHLGVSGYLALGPGNTNYGVGNHLSGPAPASIKHITYLKLEGNCLTGINTAQFAGNGIGLDAGNQQTGCATSPVAVPAACANNPVLNPVTTAAEVATTLPAVIAGDASAATTTAPAVVAPDASASAAPTMTTAAVATSGKAAATTSAAVSASVSVAAATTAAALKSGATEMAAAVFASFAFVMLV
ncbi:hypothetical protein HDU98_011780 [Podochytrium sp. JEL0797]|nr:hypothetical protein HDU98_011780 [Podochytrium sp. JEL0797]